MAVSALDDHILGPIFVADDVRAVLADERTVATYLRVEVALARAQAAVGLIPPEAPAAIAAVTPADLDLDQLRSRATAVGFPIAGLVEQLAVVVDADLGQYAHWGATTQDIVDTAVVLQLRELMTMTETALTALGHRLVALADEHRSTIMVGRSQLQPAAPTTFGLRAAGWLDAVGRHLDRIHDLGPRLYRLQLGGAVGTLAALGPHGPAVGRAMAEQLDLLPAPVAWHTARDRFVEAVAVAAGIAATLGKIGIDVALSSQFEVGELREASGPGRGISSTMPQKRNPIGAQALMHAAAIAAAQVPLVAAAGVADHDRGTGAWPLEWVSVMPAVAVAASAAITAEHLVAGLEVDAARMAANVAAIGDGLVAEAAMMQLAPTIGRQRSHDVVAAALTTAARNGGSLVDELRTGGHEIDAAAVEPRSYLGASGEQIDAAIDEFLLRTR